MRQDPETDNEAASGPNLGVVGRYRLLQCVGEGAFARVYFARDEETLAPVALKVLRDPLDPAIQEQVRIRFLAERNISKALNHRFIVQIREASAPDERPCFLAMDFIAGRTFCSHLARQRELDPEGSDAAYFAEVARLGHQVATAMESAHDKGIVHRDLKPENVLIVEGSGSRRAEVRIVDFGIAKAPVELFSIDSASSVTRYWTELGTVMGSPPFMAPEQDGAAQTATGKADVFALGVMLFCSVFGVDAEALTERGTHLVLPRDLDRLLAEHTLPAGWELMLRAMLEFDPELRPTMAEVSKRLQRLARNQSEFAVAVDAWLRRGKVPRARKMVRYMNWAEHEDYLTEDEHLFLRRAPVQRLKKFRSSVGMGLLSGGILIGGATLVTANSWYMTQFRAIENALFAERRLRIENAQALDDKAETARDLSSRLSNKQANEAERVKELRAAVGRERERRLDETRSVAEQRVLVQELQNKLSSCQVEQRSELQRSESLATKLEQQAGELERCDNKAEDLFLCKQSSAVKDRELIESTERLRLCKKHLDAATSSAEPLELGMR